MKKVSGFVGRPKLDFGKEELIYLLNKYGSPREVAEKIGVSHSTLYRRMRDLKLYRVRNFDVKEVEQ
ncbi:MAG: hypothetical protein C4589_10040 [Peptococcaceae bacterium]|nr:MAG: hypothetical protein C4589_10040 [Peptococcaceae bacterium]